MRGAGPLAIDALVELVRILDVRRANTLTAHPNRAPYGEAKPLENPR